MKKIIGVLGVAVFTATLFFSTNNVSGSKSYTDLASLLTMNTANAEADDEGECVKEGKEISSNTHFIYANKGFCFDKHGHICGESVTCTEGNKLPNIPNVTSSCQEFICL